MQPRQSFFQWGRLMMTALLLLVQRTAAQELTLVLLDPPVDIVPGAVAAFGDPIVEDTQVNLFLPPVNYSRLCKYPETLLNYTDQDRLDAIQTPIALLVDIDGCPPATKALVARRIQKELTPMVRYLIVYQSDPRRRGGLYILLPGQQLSNEERDDLNSVGLIYLPFRFYNKMMRRIADRATAMMNPFFLEEGSEDWRFRLKFQEPDPYVGGYGNGGNGRDHFYWFRFVLFSLLILAPCARAFYLWYTAGGRIRFRRNERGHIRGLQYVRPRPHWLANGMIPGRLEHVSNTLTEEEFNSLPEIKYQPPDDDEGNESSEPKDVVEDTRLGDDYDIGQRESEHAEPDITVESGLGAWEEVSLGSNGNRERQHSERETIDTEQPLSAEESREESATVSSFANLTTTCTTCSICIDEFEAGERLTLLPKCHHAFHRDCIKPWLMERQGCCPLCKTDVIGDDEESDQEPSDEHSLDAQSTEQEQSEPALMPPANESARIQI